MICLFDLGSEFWRNWYATRSGLRAYEITLDRVQSLMREYDRMVVCADSPVSMRKKLEPTYKSHREEKPQEAIDSLVSTEQRIAAWGVPLVKCEGLEADDCIASLAGQAWPEPVEIITVDKDLHALISDTVCVIGKHGRIGVNECFDKFGVPPSQMHEWIALVGDASDGIKGCDSCGPARASDLLQRFGTIEGIRAATDEEILSVRGVGKKTLEALRAWDPTMALKLIQLVADAPINLNDLLRAA